MFYLVNKGTSYNPRHACVGTMLSGINLPAEAGIQHLKSLDYSIHTCMLPFGPAFGCSNLLPADLVRPKICRDDDSY